MALKQTQNQLKKEFKKKIRCLCGCGRSLFKYDKWRRIRKFIHGHNAKKDGLTIHRFEYNRLWRKTHPFNVKKNYLRQLEKKYNGNYEKVRKRDNYKCQMCGEKEIGKVRHHVHHINGDSKDNRLQNLVLFCSWCHTAVSTFIRKKIYPYKFMKFVWHKTPGREFK